jgi:hypothetical protein
MGFSQMMSGIYDSLFAPADALGPDLDPFAGSTDILTPTMLTETHFASDTDVDWHNGFGTLNDFEVPASGFTTFDSNQGSLFDDSSSFGSSWD